MHTKRYTELLTEKMMQLSKEQLVWLLIQCDWQDALISETLVEVSKMHLTPEKAIDNIREYLRKNQANNITWFHKPEDLQAELDFKMGKISKRECRKRLGLQ